MVVVLASAGGCGWKPADRHTIRMEVLKADPTFSGALETHDNVANRIDVLERELALKRTQVERHVAQLRNELRTATTKVERDSAGLRTLLNPVIESVELVFAMGVEELKTKRSQRASLGRSISRLRKTMKDARGQWSTSQRERMEHELAELQRETQRVDQELAALNEHLRLLKKKRLLLRL